MCVFGRPIKDFISILSRKYHPHQTWKKLLNLRKEALRHRHMIHQDQWSEHIKALTPLHIEDRVRIQNQTGLVIEVRLFHQYLIRIDGSGRQSLRNKKFLRKYIPVYQPASRSILEDIVHLHPALPTDDNTTPPHHIFHISILQGRKLSLPRLQ